MLFTPVIMFLVDIFIFKNNQFIAYFSALILFTYNLIFFIFHERKYNQIFLLIAFSSFIYTVFFSFLFFYRWKKTEITYKKILSIDSHEQKINEQNQPDETKRIESEETTKKTVIDSLVQDEEITFQ
jgi:predicted membrane protein